MKRTLNIFGALLLITLGICATAHARHFPYTTWNHPKAASTIFITDVTPTGSARSGNLWVGYRVTNVDALPHVIDELSRWGVSGNTHPHEVRFIRVSDNATIASTVVTAAGASFAAHTATGNTAASDVYYVVSDETAGLEDWNDAFVGGTPQVRSHTAAFAIDGIVYSGDGISWTFTPIADAAYGPPNFRYH
jgi:hypothetical protein